MQEAVAIKTGVHGDDHTDVADSLTLLASCLVAQGRFDEAYEHAGAAKQMLVSALGDNHWRTALAASAEGAALAGLERYAEAEPLLVESYTVLSNDAGAMQALVDTAGDRLVSLYEALGKPEKAAEVLTLAEE